MTRSKFAARRDEINALVLQLPNDAAGNMAAVSISAHLLLAETVNDFAILLAKALAEVYPEDAVRRTKRAGGDSDVNPLSDEAETRLQAEAYGADPVDPEAPVDDTEDTLHEFSSINRGRGVAAPPNPHE